MPLNVLLNKICKSLDFIFVFRKSMTLEAREKRVGLGRDGRKEINVEVFKVTRVKMINNNSLNFDTGKVNGEVKGLLRGLG